MKTLYETIIDMYDGTPNRENEEMEDVEWASGQFSDPTLLAEEEKTAHGSSSSSSSSLNWVTKKIDSIFSYKKED